MLEGEKRPYAEHEKCMCPHVAWIMCLRTRVWEEEHKSAPLINNKAARVGGLWIVLITRRFSGGSGSDVPMFDS